MDKLSDEQKQELKTTFDSFDIDGNGSISAEEMKIVLGKMGEPNDDKTVADLIATVDTDGNGNLSFDEFIKIATSLMDGCPSLQKLEQAFKNFDENGDGVINRKELESRMKLLGFKLSKKEIKQMIKDADDNGDGLINYVEFCHMLQDQ